MATDLIPGEIAQAAGKDGQKENRGEIQISCANHGSCGQQQELGWQGKAELLSQNAPKHQEVAMPDQNLT